jgi:folate-binding protein YgfZ
VPSPLLTRAGAVGEAVPAHYGNPLAEQRLLEGGSALVDCSHFGVITLTGPDRLTWLDSLSSQLLLGLLPGETKEDLILDPHGHIEHRFLITDDGETSWLLVEPGRAEALIQWLLKMRFRMHVDINDVSSEVAVVASSSTDVSLEKALVVWIDPWPSIAEGGVSYSRISHPGEGFSLRFTAIPRSALDEGLSVEWAGLDALDALLVRAARPTMAEVDDKTLPHELDLLRTAVHVNKGCYRGQETIAKVHNLGHPPRRGVLLHVDGSEGELPEAGAVVRAGEKDVGRVTRLVRHHEWGPLAYAVIKRNVDTQAALIVVGAGGDIPATQEVLVHPDSGATRREALNARRQGQ